VAFRLEILGDGGVGAGVPVEIEGGGDAGDREDRKDRDRDDVEHREDEPRHQGEAEIDDDIAGCPAVEELIGVVEALGDEGGVTVVSHQSHHQ